MKNGFILLRAHDGHEVTTYEAAPAGKPRGGIVLLQEIFGVTAHIRRVCDIYAGEGYHTVAPALFDRIAKGRELGYSKEDAATGREMRSRIPWDQTRADAAAAIRHLSGAGKIASIGYCWGGTVSWRLAAQAETLSASVCYYPTQISPFVSEKPRCPVLMHFGEVDPIATLADAGQLRSAHGANVEIQVYPASHGFNCDEISNFHPASAKQASRRTLDFLDVHLG
jgi:carboxymethylenebutenolidase